MIRKGVRLRESGVARRPMPRTRTPIPYAAKPPPVAHVIWGRPAAKLIPRGGSGNKRVEFGATPAAFGTIADSAGKHAAGTALANRTRDRDRAAMAPAFLASAILILTTTRDLMTRLRMDLGRRLCGW